MRRISTTTTTMVLWYAFCVCITALTATAKVTPTIKPKSKPTKKPTLKPTTKPIPKPPTFKPVMPPTVKPVLKPTTKPIVKPTTKPVAPTTRPVAPTPKPIAPTTRPIAPTPKPIAPTPKPIAPTPKPIAPTPKPVAPTIKPVVVPTSAPTPVLSPLAKKIAQYAPGSVFAFVPGSYQAKALAYVQSLPNVNTLTTSKIIQYYALSCIFYATNGVANQVTLALNPPITSPRGWLVKTNWLSTTIDPCSGSWVGVTCVNNKVTKLDLSQKGLTGGIPYEITLLSADHPSGAGNINYIDLYNNPYVFNDGDIGQLNWIGGLGSNMQKLYVGTTSMYSSKGVPDFLSNLTNLLEFDCSYTYIRGPLRSTPFAKLKQLQYLELDGNAYNSSLPTVLSTLPNLIYLYAANAFVSGDLSFLKGMPKIVEVWVDQNSLKGTLPTFLGSLTTLQSFSVSRNLISGSFPSQMAALTEMTQMWFYSNRLAGTFPNNFATMSNLKTFHLENNNNVVGNVGSLCSALGPPLGVMITLGVDCATGGKITCPSSCKICCCSLSLCGDS